MQVFNVFVGSARYHEVDASEKWEKYFWTFVHQFVDRIDMFGVGVFVHDKEK